MHCISFRKDQHVSGGSVLVNRVFNFSIIKRDLCIHLVAKMLPCFSVPCSKDTICAEFLVGFPYFHRGISKFSHCFLFTSILIVNLNYFPASIK